jgi:hypothetical protein
VVQVIVIYFFSPEDALRGTLSDEMEPPSIPIDPSLWAGN